MQKYFGLMILIGLSIIHTQISYAASLNILSFQKLPLSKIEQQQICQQLKSFCDHQQNWRSLKSSEQHLWLLSDHEVAQFQLTKAGLKYLQHWKIDATPQTHMMSKPAYIFPKLFPMDKHRYAIAMVQPFSEMYSGGGASIERADFYELKSDGRSQAFIRNYPFYLNRMIRACFSAEDYERAKDICHDEDALSLDIRPIKPMLWQFRYQYRLSVSPASDSTEKSYQDRRHLNIDLNDVPQQPNIPLTWNYAGQE